MGKLMPASKEHVVADHETLNASALSAAPAAEHAQDPVPQTAQVAPISVVQPSPVAAVAPPVSVRPAETVSAPTPAAPPVTSRPLEAAPAAPPVSARPAESSAAAAPPVSARPAVPATAPPVAARAASPAPVAEVEKAPTVRKAGYLEKQGASGNSDASMMVIGNDV